MLLEARPVSILSTKLVLTLNGQPIGNFVPISFSQGFKLSILGQNLTFAKPSWMRNRFVLKNEADRELGTVTLDGWLIQRWWICCGSENGYAVLSGWPKSVFHLFHDEKIVATAEWPNVLCRSWQLIADDTMSTIYVVLVGMAFHLSRQRGPDKIHRDDNHPNRW